MKTLVFLSIVFLSSSLAQARCPKKGVVEAPMESTNLRAAKLLNHYKIDLNSVISLRSVPGSYKNYYTKAHKYTLDPFCSGGTIHTLQNFVVKFNDGNKAECFEVKVHSSNIKIANRTSTKYDILGSPIEACK